MDDGEVPGGPLSGAALDALLEFLHPGDRVAAGREYERVRRRLHRVLEWRGAVDAMDVVDETMNRVAGQLAGGREITTAEPLRYCRGVADRVFKERRKRRQREMRAALEAAREEGRRREEAAAAEEDRPTQEARLRLLRQCLELFTVSQRRLILAYYTGDHRARIRNRKRLARENGWSALTLRLRVHRLRQRLERCVRERLDGG